MSNTVILGAGPSGLACAYEILRNNRKNKVIILEKENRVGGLCRNYYLDGNTFDAGGHRFSTDIKEVNSLWHHILKGHAIKVRKKVGIYYQGKTIDYPIRIDQIIKKYGIGFGSDIIKDYIITKIKNIARKDKDNNFESIMKRKFGSKLYNSFFKPYSEKVWGVKAIEISENLAKTRIEPKNLLSAIRKSKSEKQEYFLYPKKGSGEFYDLMEKEIEKKGCTIEKNAKITKIHHKNKRIKEITYIINKNKKTILCDSLISTIPIKDLILLLEPKIDIPNKNLRYRSLITIFLTTKQKLSTDFCWVYIHSSGIKASRLQIYKNWNKEMCKDECLGLEYHCSYNDKLWKLNNSKLAEQAKDDLIKLNIIKTKGDIKSTKVAKLSHAYPLMIKGYKKESEEIKKQLFKIKNLRLAGRNGTHSYIDMDKAIMSGINAARKIKS